jgi:hypothetical protein
MRWTAAILLIAVSALPKSPADDRWLQVLGFPGRQIAAALACLAPALLLLRRGWPRRALGLTLVVALMLQVLRIWH